MLKFVSLIAILFFLSGCTSQLPQKPPALPASSPEAVTQLDQIKNLNTFYAVGKVAFSDGKKGGTASIEWQQLGRNYSIILIGALGSGTLALQGDGDQIILTTSQGEHDTARTPEQLIEKHLGWVMPISSLQYWLKGVDAPGQPPVRMQWDQQNRLAVLEQQGWIIQYISYMPVSGFDLPAKIQMDRGPIRLRFIFRQWRF